MSEAETHVITTSTRASLDEPQPTLSQEEGGQQQPQEVEAQENVPEPTPPSLIIQPQISSQEELDVEPGQQEEITPIAEDADADSPHKEVKKKKKRKS